MGDTNIEWTATQNPDGTITKGKVWNPVTGCTPVSEGCRNCYAKRLHDMRHKAFLAGKKLPQQYAKPFSEIQLHYDRLEQPLHWKKPAKIFVNSMSDLFHPDVELCFTPEVFAVMAVCQQHTFQILTKRPELMYETLIDNEFIDKVADIVWFDYKHLSPAGMDDLRTDICGGDMWPLPNVWLLTSIEDQKTADERITWLLKTPAATRGVSYEPALGPVDLFDVDVEIAQSMGKTLTWPSDVIDWVIMGGESGTNARPMHPDWARSMRDQCNEVGVPFFFKQWGEWVHRDQYDGELPNLDAMHRVGKKKAGRSLDGREWSEFPNVW